MNTPTLWASQVVLGLKNSPANIQDARDVGLIPGSGRSPGGEHGNHTHTWRIPVDRGAWWAIPDDQTSDSVLYFLWHYYLGVFLCPSVSQLAYYVSESPSVQW